MGDETEDEKVLAAFARTATESLDRRAGDRDADVDGIEFRLHRLDVVRVVDADSAWTEGSDVAVVAVLVEGEENRTRPRGEHFARTEWTWKMEGPPKSSGEDRQCRS